MKRSPRDQDSSTLLRWTFRYGAASVVAQVIRRGSTFVLTLANASSQAPLELETFDSAVAAFARHAALAASLREHGWTVASYSGASRGRRAVAA